MRSYEAARSLFSFLGFIAWSIIVIGALIALASMGAASKFGGGGAGLLAMVPGIAIGVLGFIMLAFVQMGRATVDTAEYTQQMLQISRDQLEVSQQGLKQNAQAAKSFASGQSEHQAESGFKKSDFETQTSRRVAEENRSVAAKLDRPLANGDSIVHFGKKITYSNGIYYVGKESFGSIVFAKSYAECAEEIEIEEVSIELLKPLVENRDAIEAPEALDQVAADPSEYKDKLIEQSSKEREVFAAPQVISKVAIDPNEYRGKTIIAADGEYLCNGIPFKSREAAKSYVDNLSKPPMKPLPGVKR